MAQDTQLQMRINAALIEQLDELRRRERDIPSRSEMIRRLIERATAAEGVTVQVADFARDYPAPDQGGRKGNRG